jgi:3-oxoadipate enol-lactonase
VKHRVLGSGGIPVVKIAGLVGGVGLYEEEMEAVSRAGFLVVAADTTGDRADDPAPAPLTWDGLSSDVIAALDTRKIPRAVLWGSSFGCLVALAASARHPDRVAGLLLCHPPNPWGRPRYQRALLAWVEKQKDPARTLELVFTLGFRALAGWEGIYPTLIGRVPRLLRANNEAATPARTMLEKTRLLTHEPPGLPSPESRIPISILAARWDTIAPYREARGLSEKLAGSRLITLRFTGHSGAHSRPYSYARAVLNELTRLSGESR